MEEIQKTTITHKTHTPKMYEECIKTFGFKPTALRVHHLMDLHNKALNMRLVFRALDLAQAEEKRNKRTELPKAETNLHQN